MWQKTKNIYHLLVAILANTLYKFPSRRFICIGITGTDGKTTTVNLIYHILKSSGKQASVISTVGAVIDGATFPLGFHVTTPSPMQLQKFISRILTRKGSTNYMVLEVTSHSLNQNRVWGIPFAIAGVTNITHEHLDYHKTYDNYLREKAKLLKKAKIAVINRDDNSYNALSDILSKKQKKIITYGMGNNSDVNPSNFEVSGNISSEHNRYNALLAVSVCKQLGLSDSEIKSGIETFVLPKGRGEVVYEKDFSVIIDFAHTPNAFEKFLTSIKPKSKGRIIHVFGSAGLRDKSKRPVMGNVSANFADIIILTSEDPRSENVEKIIDEIESGITKNQREKIRVERFADRQLAINRAIGLARTGDIVAITGKAHEKSMNFGKGEEAWDEFEAVKTALKKRNG